MQRIELHVTQVFPIAVGSRVDVRIFMRKMGIITTTLEPAWDQPLITDLGTGIVYGDIWHFVDVNMYQANQVREIPNQVRADRQEHTRFTAQVAGCRIVWIGGGDSRYPQTSLLLDVVAA